MLAASLLLLLLGPSFPPLLYQNIDFVQLAFPRMNAAFAAGLLMPFAAARLGFECAPCTFPALPPAYWQLVQEKLEFELLANRAATDLPLSRLQALPAL